MKDLYFEAYFKSSHDYYIGKLRKFNDGKKVSFNLPAFLFGLFWLIYRKMYKQALVVFLILLALSFLQQILYKSVFNYNVGLYQLSQIITNIICAICIGFFGNWFYINHANKKVQKVVSENFEENLILEKLSKVGGTSYLALSIAIFFFTLLILLSKKA